jgi:hypothetical protein
VGGKPTPTTIRSTSSAVQPHKAPAGAGAGAGAEAAAAAAVGVPGPGPRQTGPAPLKSVEFHPQCAPMPSPLVVSAGEPQGVHFSAALRSILGFLLAPSPALSALPPSPPSLHVSSPPLHHSHPNSQTAPSPACVWREWCGQVGRSGGADAPSASGAVWWSLPGGAATGPGPNPWEDVSSVLHSLAATDTLSSGAGVPLGKAQQPGRVGPASGPHSRSVFGGAPWGGAAPGIVRLFCSRDMLRPVLAVTLMLTWKRVCVGGNWRVLHLVAPDANEAQV